MNCFKSSPSGVYMLGRNNEKSTLISGPLEVVANTFNPEKSENFGKLIKWESIIGTRYSEVFLLRDIADDGGKQLRRRLVDTGLKMPPKLKLWGLIIEYILQAEPKETYVSVERTGWINSVYVMPDWISGHSESKIIFRNSTGIEKLNTNGNASEWGHNLAMLCKGNPLMIFTICASLAAPFLRFLGWDSFGLHLVGTSKSGKTTLLKLGVSIYSDWKFADSWRGTANGLEARARTRNDLPLFLDELHQAPADDVDKIIYLLGNGVSKLRSNRKSTLNTQERWSLIYLSSGEIGLSEKLAESRKTATAGQFMRFFEIPVIRKYGAFDDLHGFNSSKDFADKLNDLTTQYYGTTLQPWINHMIKNKDIKNMLVDKIKSIREAWIENTGDPDSSQIKFGMDRFAFIAAIGEIGIEAKLLPWDAGDAISSAGQIFNTWRVNIDSESDHEMDKIIKHAKKIVKNWTHSFTSSKEMLDESSPGYWTIENGEVFWYVKKENFEDGFSLQFRTQIQPTSSALHKKNWLLTNESERGTFRINFPSKPIRYYKLRPQNIAKDLNIEISFKHFYEDDE